MLVVDDDISFIRPVCDYFKEHIDKIFEAETYEKAKQLLSAEFQEGLDLVLIDINLAGTESMAPDLRGLEIAKDIAEKYPGCPIVLVTGMEDITEQVLEAAGDLEIVEFLRKPLGVIKLREMLSSAFRKKLKTLREFIARSVPQEQAIEKSYKEPEEHDSSWHVNKILQELKDETGANISILFSIHPVTYQVEIVASSGDLNISRRFFKKLRFSPVRDVAIDEEIIFEVDATLNSVAGKHLRRSRWSSIRVRFEKLLSVWEKLKRTIRNIFNFWYRILGLASINATGNAFLNRVLLQNLKEQEWGYIYAKVQLKV
jgi:FixJ family two-component response regulator